MDQLKEQTTIFEKVDMIQRNIMENVMEAPFWKQELLSDLSHSKDAANIPFFIHLVRTLKQKDHIAMIEIEDEEGIVQCELD